MRFGRRGKLIPRFIDPFENLRRVRELSYEIALPLALSSVHNVFHIFIFRQYFPDESHMLQWELVQLDKTLRFKLEPVAILDRQVRQLRSKKISLVKVQ
ncbi:hypothetical protein MTR67_007338 [Solanum verrucosum]|uniref:Tf2-1-like SH3-like domain-containing protein n=1 Tax=Solanum verrucosum TaxID=315347 RepID=A0AAF0Q018_SOLVR|nr:hypothetical protein MTR67_007338 [Solanum verrucosum]